MLYLIRNPTPPQPRHWFLLVCTLLLPTHWYPSNSTLSPFLHHISDRNNTLAFSPSTIVVLFVRYLPRHPPTFHETSLIALKCSLPPYFLFFFFLFAALSVWFVGLAAVCFDDVAAGFLFDFCCYCCCCVGCWVSSLDCPL